MKKKGIAIHTNTKWEDRRCRWRQRLTLVGGKTVDADVVLIATGRKPYAKIWG